MSWDGTTILVRPSGTEPKIKVYILTQGSRCWASTVERSCQSGKGTGRWVAALKPPAPSRWLSQSQWYAIRKHPFCSINSLDLFNYTTVSGHHFLQKPYSIKEVSKNAAGESGYSPQFLPCLVFPARFFESRRPSVFCRRFFPPIQFGSAYRGLKILLAPTAISGSFRV